MHMKKIMSAVISFGLTMLLAVTSVLGARPDMLDVSNHNGNMTVAEYVSARNRYGVKAVTTKISEGTTYVDPYAKTNITNAQQAGLYINGYYFTRYTNVAQAKAEARFAVQSAKNAGLPINAVLCADIEASQQQSLGTYVNNLAINAMKQIVENAGYRFDVYTMASWLDTNISTSQAGWIAMYPYNVAKDRYTNKHAWQWASDFKLADSYGNFDVSQLYDNYYTGGINKNAVISNANTADYTHRHQINKPNNNPNMTAESYIEDYAQNGVFTANTTLNIRTAPSTSATIVGTYAPSESLIYDHVYIRNGYVWARYMSYSGQWHYIAMGRNGGESYGTRQPYKQRKYTVRAGDSLTSIANRLGVSVATLANQNGINNINLIYAGQVLTY